MLERLATAATLDSIHHLEAALKASVPLAAGYGDSKRAPHFFLSCIITTVVTLTWGRVDLQAVNTNQYPQIRRTWAQLLMLSSANGARGASSIIDFIAAGDDSASTVSDSERPNSKLRGCQASVG
jgi:hypothetical protein